MSLQGLLTRRVSGVLLCCGVWMPFQAVMAQQAISNPLVRPAGLGAGGASGAAAAQKTEAQNAAAQPPASPDLRDKAASRLSQEDFNLKQQALNASAIPAPLGSLFNQMMVSAVVGGSVVLRRADVLAAQGQQQATQAGTTGTGGQTNGGGGGRGATGLGVAGGAVVTSSVLRLKVGQATNLNGYVLRARVEGMDVFVDWKNEMGAWVGVFFGALESAGTVAVTPAKDTLEKVDTSSFDYLKPQVSNRVSGNSTTGTNGQNGSSNNSGLGNTGSSNTGSAASF